MARCGGHGSLLWNIWVEITQLNEYIKIELRKSPKLICPANTIDAVQFLLSQCFRKKVACFLNILEHAIYYAPAGCFGGEIEA
jgi:hypothetical protein